MKIVHFIVNPIAGKGKPIITEQYLSNHFNKKDFSVTVKYSEYKGHAIPLTEQSIKENASIIVACGGDGTINEVASCLVNTNIVLGIIPIGSGNGLARNLKIPTNIEKAINNIKENSTIAIDVGKINDDYFFSNTGFGFDASVIKNYEASQDRSLWTYVMASIKSFKEYNKEDEVEIEVNGAIQMINPFLIFISNSNVMGYQMSLTPKASLQDGLLDVVMVPKLSKWKMLVFGVLMLLKKPELLKEVSCFQTNSIHLLRKNGTHFQSQIDGELFTIPSSSVSIQLKESSLLVIT